MTDYAARIRLCRHCALLTVRQSPLVVRFDWEVERVGWKVSLCPRDTTLYATCDNCGDPDAKGLDLHAESVAVCVQSGFCGIVGTAENVRHYPSETTDHYHAWRRTGSTLLGGSIGGGDKQRHEGLGDTHNAEDVGVEGNLYLGNRQVEAGDGIVTPRIVHKDVEMRMACREEIP